MLLPSLLWSITAFICLGWSTAQTVTQSPPAASIQETEAVTLECVYTTSDPYYYLYWYRQSPNGKLIYILLQSSQTSSVRRGRYSVNFHKEAKSISLTISSSRLEDSGMYFCGLRRSHSALIDGKSCTKTSKINKRHLPSPAPPLKQVREEPLLSPRAEVGWKEETLGEHSGRV
uniref:Ig-like domain-containing protein n=1 Tax=Vombatus ursinus TaxID=29139 RepID=A0A4X2LRF9_VOMUR